MTELSPQARTVQDAVLALYADCVPRESAWAVDAGIVAAALRAAADQVVPEYAEPVGDAHDDARHAQWMRIRYKLLAIADELEGAA